MFEELKKQCLNALQSEAEGNNYELVLLGETTHVTRAKVMKLYSFLVEMDEKKSDSEIKKYISDNYYNFPYILDWNDSSEVNQFQDWIDKVAAEQGNAFAQYVRGNMHYYGDGTAIDQQKAMGWYKKSAEQGYADAQYMCGMMYYKGEGTAVNKPKALHWYKKAAKQGDANAQFLCGEMY